MLASSPVVSLNHISGRLRIPDDSLNYGKTLARHGLGRDPYMDAQSLRAPVVIERAAELARDAHVDQSRAEAALTLALATPGSFSSADSISPEQAAQCMPATWNCDNAVPAGPSGQVVKGARACASASAAGKPGGRALTMAI